MPLPGPLRRPVVLVLVLVILGGVGLAVYVLFFGQRMPPGLPGPDSPLYQKYVAEFQVGTAALDVLAPPEGAEAAKPGETGIRDLAYSHLTEAIQTIPEEPAAWADRGLWFLRNNRLTEAAKDLGRAELLAPQSPEIHRLLGLLYKKDGKYGEAARRFRLALEIQPNDLPTLYALTQALDQEAGEGSDQESLKLLNRALAIQPNNLRLLHAKGILAARLSDQQVLGEVAAAYRRLEPEWSGTGAADARRLLDTLAGQARGLVGDEAAFTLNRLNNNLQAEKAYVRDGQALQADEQNQGEPVERFLRLTPMRASPSLPDVGLEFEPASPPGLVSDAVSRARWDMALPVWLTQDTEPVVFVANASQVRRAASDVPVLEFPGGAKAVPPTAHGILAIDWNNDFRTDLICAGAGGLRFFRQGDDGQFTDVTAKTGLDRATLTAEYFGGWAADIEMDGDLDIIAAPRRPPGGPAQQWGWHVQGDQALSRCRSGAGPCVGGHRQRRRLRRRFPGRTRSNPRLRQRAGRPVPRTAPARWPRQIPRPGGGRRHRRRRLRPDRPAR